jgi:hypothetical protein
MVTHYSVVPPGVESVAPFEIGFDVDGELGDGLALDLAEAGLASSISGGRSSLGTSHRTSVLESPVPWSPMPPGPHSS